jgi:hypothetical protein
LLHISPTLRQGKEKIELQRDAGGGGRVDCRNQAISRFEAQSAILSAMGILRQLIQLSARVTFQSPTNFQLQSQAGLATVARELVIAAQELCTRMTEVAQHIEQMQYVQSTRFPKHVN